MDIINPTNHYIHGPFEGVNAARERAAAQAKPARSYCWLAVVVTLAIFAVVLSGCAIRIEATLDSYDRGACLVVLADGSSALRYPGEAGCWL